MEALTAKLAEARANAKHRRTIYQMCKTLVLNRDVDAIRHMGGLYYEYREAVEQYRTAYNAWSSARILVDLREEGRRLIDSCETIEKIDSDDEPGAS